MRPSLGDGEFRFVANFPEPPAAKPPAAKRAAQAVPRYGLVHIAALATGSPVPQALQALQYRAVVVEVGAGEFTGGVHGLLPRLILKGVPMLLAGPGTDVVELTQFLRGGMQNEMLYETEVTLCRPGGDGPYRFRTTMLRILSRSPLPYKVCLASCFSAQVYASTIVRCPDPDIALIHIRRFHHLCATAH